MTSCTAHFNHEFGSNSPNNSTHPFSSRPSTQPSPLIGLYMHALAIRICLVCVCFFLSTIPFPLGFSRDPWSSEVAQSCPVTPSSTSGVLLLPHPYDLAHHTRSHLFFTADAHNGARHSGFEIVCHLPSLQHK